MSTIVGIIQMIQIYIKVEQLSDRYVETLRISILKDPGSILGSVTLENV